MRIPLAALALVVAAWGCGSNASTEANRTTPPPVTPTTTSAGDSSAPTTSTTGAGTGSAIEAGKALARSGTSQNPFASLSGPAKTVAMPADAQSRAAGSGTGAQSYFPMAEGNTWIYSAVVQVQTGNDPVKSASLEIQFKMSDVHHDGNKTTAALNVYEGDQIVDKSTWMQDPSGIFQLSSGVNSIPFSQPEPVLKLPVPKAEQVLPWSNSGLMPDGKMGHQSGKTTVSTSQQIDTGISTVVGVECAQTADYASSDSSGKAGTSTFFTPGVGIVRLVQSLNKKTVSTVTTLRLKSWTLQH